MSAVLLYKRLHLLTNLVVVISALEVVGGGCKSSDARAQKSPSAVSSPLDRSGHNPPIVIARGTIATFFQSIASEEIGRAEANLTLIKTMADAAERYHVRLGEWPVDKSHLVAFAEAEGTDLDLSAVSKLEFTTLGTGDQARMTFEIPSASVGRPNFDGYVDLGVASTLGDEK